MKIAITIWNERVSPVFDVARNIVVLDIEEKEIKQKSLEAFANDQPEYKASRLKQLEVSTLICGAVSRYYARIISAHQIEMIPFISGEINDIIQAFLSDKLPNPRLLMPGCCKNQNFFSRRHRKCQ